MEGNEKTATNALCYLGGSKLAALIRAKKVSSREVVQAHLDRIKATNPKVNAIVTLMDEAALKGADGSR